MEPGGFAIMFLEPGVLLTTTFRGGRSGIGLNDGVFGRLNISAEHSVFSYQHCSTKIDNICMMNGTKARHGNGKPEPFAHLVQTEEVDSALLTNRARLKPVDDMRSATTQVHTDLNFSLEKGPKEKGNMNNANNHE